VFDDFEKTLDKKFNQRRGLWKLRDIMFELRVMACFRHLHLGDPISEHQGSDTLDNFSFHRLLLEKFSLWMSEMKDEYINLQRTDEEINHVERLFRDHGHPWEIISINCICVGWHKCSYTLKVQCMTTGPDDSKGKPSLVLKIVVSRTTKIQSILFMHWGATTYTTIYKFGADVHKLMMGIYATRKFMMWKYHNT
jgi:hypothetical protein